MLIISYKNVFVVSKTFCNTYFAFLFTIFASRRYFVSFEVMRLKLSFSVHYLTQSEKYMHLTNQMPDFEIFCYAGKPKYLIHIWQSVVVGQGIPEQEGFY